MSFPWRLAARPILRNIRRAERHQAALSISSRDNNRRTLSTRLVGTPTITAVETSDYAEWSRLFRAYNNRRPVSTKSIGTPAITELEASDYPEWARLFRAYINFYETAIHEPQYKRTFERLMDSSSDLHGLVLRDATDRSKLYGIAHFFPHQTPWSEKQIMHFNDLYIDPELRGLGLGKRMIEEVAKISKEAGCFRLEWATKHDNPARKLYDQFGESVFVEYRIKLDDF